ncbi:hypothetical protein COAQ111491_05690 [Comamonas aquatilis]
MFAFNPSSEGPLLAGSSPPSPSPSIKKIPAEPPLCGDFYWELSRLGQQRIHALDVGGRVFGQTAFSQHSLVKQDLRQIVEVD